MNNIYHYICFDNSTNDLFPYQYFSIKSLINQDILNNNSKIYFHYYNDKLLEGLLLNKLKNNLIFEKIFFYNNTGVFRKLHQLAASPTAPHPGAALLGATENLYSAGSMRAFSDEDPLDLPNFIGSTKEHMISQLISSILEKYGGIYVDFKTLYINTNKEKYSFFSKSNELSSELIFNEINNYSFKNYFNLVNNYNIIHFDINNDFLKNISMNFIFNNITIYTLLIRYILGYQFYKEIEGMKKIDGMKKIEEKYNLINNIDYIFWINLDNSVDRKENMINILNNFKIPNIRISAVDGGLISDINKKYYYCQDDYNQFPNFSNKEYAVLLSHLNTIEKFAKMDNSQLKYEIALICEDDLSLDFINYWSLDLKTLIENAPLEWDIIMLGYFSLNLNRKGMYNKWSGEFSAISYLINYNGAKKMCKLKFNHQNNDEINKENIDNNKKDLWTCNKDDLMVSDSYIFSKLNTYVYKYPLFTFPENIDSTIHQDHIQYHKIYKNNNYITLENIYEEYISE